MHEIPAAFCRSSAHSVESKVPAGHNRDLINCIFFAVEIVNKQHLHVTRRSENEARVSEILPKLVLALASKDI